MNSTIYKNIFLKIQEADNILLTTHENPDGDALASMCSFYEVLKKQGKKFIMYCYNQPDEQFSFLPYVEKITSQKQKIDCNKIDLALIFDCASLQRTQVDNELKECNFPIINIDHHISNDGFGDINLINEKSVSTTQIIYELFKDQGVEISKNIANCILTGILTDSGNFAYSATRPETFDIASEMLIKGASVRDIINYTHKNKKIQTLKIWGLALSRLQHNTTYDIAYTVLTQKDLADYGASREDLDGIANFLNNLKDAKIVMVLYELGDGRIKGSFRTTRDGVDVARLAKEVGGGGHIKAAGFEVEGKLEYTDNNWKIV